MTSNGASPPQPPPHASSSSASAAHAHAHAPPPPPAPPASSSSSQHPSDEAKGSEAHADRFDSIEDTVAAVARGEFVVVLDDEDRENEGDLIVSAKTVTTKQMAWFIKHTSGFICISLHPSRIASLQIPMMVPQNTEKNKTAYTVTVDYRHGTTTGISAHDRALTSRYLADESLGASADDFTRPGHMNPLRYTEGGVRRRKGHTEASVDLCVAAGLPPAALLCELVDDADDDGHIAARDACFRFARRHALRITTIEKLRAWREAREGALPPPGAAGAAVRPRHVEEIRQQSHDGGVDGGGATAPRGDGASSAASATGGGAWPSSSVNGGAPAAGVGDADAARRKFDEERGVRIESQRVAEPRWPVEATATATAEALSSSQGGTAAAAAGALQ